MAPQLYFDSNSDLFCLESCKDFLNRDQKHENFPSESDPFDPANYFALQSDELDYLRNLVVKETVFTSRNYIDSLSTNSRLQDTRSECIQWILNTRQLHRYQFLTAYLSVTYFDRFLSNNHPFNEDSWVYRMGCVACFALAVKMEESRVPSLSELVVGDFQFEIKGIEKMEILVLNKLGWRLGSITPFAFLHYFIVKMCAQSIPKEIVPKAVDYIMESAKEYRFLYHAPSVVAAAAVLAAFSDKLIRNEFEAKLAAISSIGPLNSDDVFFCYIEMVGIEMRKRGIPPDLSPNPINRTRYTSASGVRRRLQFDDNDPRSPSKRTHRV